MRKTLLSLSSVMLMSLAAAGCVPSGSQESAKPAESQAPAAATAAPGSTDKKIALNVMFMEQSAAAALEKLGADYTKKNPNVEVKFQYTPNSQFKGVIRPQLLSGEGPDLFMVYYDLASFTEDLSQRPWVDRLLPAMKEGLTVQGKLIEMPMTSAGYAVFYNTELFAKLNLKVPTTYEEFLATCETIKKEGITPLALGMKDGFVPNSALAQFLSNFYANQSKDYYEQLWSGSAKISQNVDFKQGVENFLALNEKGYFSKGVLSEGYEATYKELAAGKAAMIVQGTWLPSFTSDMNKDLKLGSFILPNPNGGDPSVELFPDWNLGVNKNSKNKEEALKFLDFIAEKENIAYLDTEWKSVPPFKDVQIDLGEPMQGFLDGVAKYKTYQPWYPLVTDPNYEFIKVLTDALAGKAKLDEALQKYDNILAQNKGSLDALFKK